MGPEPESNPKRPRYRWELFRERTAKTVATLIPISNIPTVDGSGTVAAPGAEKSILTDEPGPSGTGGGGMGFGPW